MSVDSTRSAHAVPPEPWRSFLQDFDTQLKGAVALRCLGGCPGFPRDARPQKITRNGRKAVVVVCAEEWERKTERMGTLAESFASSRLRASGLKVKRSKDKLRPADL
jgi:hypothetical protein